MVKGNKRCIICLRALIISCILIFMIKELITFLMIHEEGHLKFAGKRHMLHNNNNNNTRKGSNSKRKTMSTAKKSVEHNFRESEKIFKDMMNNYYMDYDQYYRPMLTRAFNFRPHTKAAVKDLIEPQCGVKPYLLIQVHSAAININKRLAIRHSWGHYVGRNAVKASLRRRVQTIFIVGRSMVNSINLVIQKESSEYKDILFNDFTDSYRTLSNKTIHGLTWANENCMPDFLLKTDDDCYVNIPNVLEYLQTRLPKDLYTGRIFWYRLTDRDKSSQYYTSYQTYRGIMYPPYASGGGYILAGHLIPTILNASAFHKIVPNEDAYIGILMDAIEVLPLDNKKVLPYIFCNESVWDRPACDFVQPLVMHGVYNYAQIWIHYHVKVLSIVSGLCQHSMKNRKKMDIPLYCYSYEDVLVIERAKLRGFL